MVKVADLPSRVRILQLLLQPGILRWVEVIAVKDEKTTVSLGKGIIFGSAHVIQLIEAFIRVVVIAQRSVELHVQGKQQSIGTFEFVFKIAGATAVIDIVS